MEKPSSSPSSSSVLESEEDGSSQSRRVGDSSDLSGLVIDRLTHAGPEFDDEEVAAAAADEDANEDPALGG